MPHTELDAHEKLFLSLYVDLTRPLTCLCGWEGTLEMTYILLFNPPPSGWMDYNGKRGGIFSCPTCHTRLLSYIIG